MDLLDRMLGHDRWATAQLLDKCRGLTDEQLDQQFDIGRTSLRDTLHHLIFVIGFWTSQMTGQPFTRRHEGKPSIVELFDLHERNHDAFDDCARRMYREQQLDQTFFDHYDYPQSIGATIIQVYTHNTQHRSEVRHMLERFGVQELWDYDPQEWEHATGQVSNVQRGE
jgi:uncharacterized damage-inducible protein DinB